MPAVYRIEVASTGRAGCRNTECKNEGIKIEKGALRVGSYVEIQEHGSFHWKHWGCVTPVQISSWWENAEHDLDLIDGYDELPEDMKEKVERALKQGHVDDEDWKGDVEKNRPGEKGYRLTQKQKAEKEAKENGTQDSPAKPTPKKRARKADADNDDDAPPAKKKAPAKKGTKAKVEAESEDEAAPAPKKGKSAKKAAAPAAVDSDIDAEEAPKPKKAPAARKQKAVEADEDEEKSKPAPKKKAAPHKKKDSPVDDEDAEDEPVPKKKAATRKKKATA